MFAPEMKIEKFDLVDVITTSITPDACTDDAALPCLAD